MDILYYSNQCKHSQRILHFLVKGNLADKLNFLCIDKRIKDPKTNQIYIVLEDGKKVVMPPNVQSVPALLLVKEKYRVVLGEDIIAQYQGAATVETRRRMVEQNIEPIGTSLSGGGVVSEQFTSYDLSPIELSSKGGGGRRSMHNYVSADEEIISINAPPDDYQPDKLSSDVTIDMLQQKRMDDVPRDKPPNTPSFSI
jgi:hypothetical protein|tara:strand:- start:572 stop:1165 length:594 start_codon:yes stop_codon:yes gene_type:complete